MYVGRITIYVYAASTRVPFAITGVYASKGLGLRSYAAVGSLVAFSLGRAVSASVLKGKGQSLLLKIFPSLTTIGYLLIAFLLPAIENLDEFGTITTWEQSVDYDGSGTARRPVYATSEITVILVYGFLSFLTGLSETITALDYFVKREVSRLPLVEQQKTYRLILVFTGLGSCTAFLSALLYEAYGIRIVALCAAGMSFLHTSLT